MTKPTISAVINTKNSAETLERTLKSLSWVDEIVVVDMESTDETKLIAKKYTDKIFTTTDVGYVEPARNEAIDRATSEWILIVDADEEIPSSLSRKLIELSSSNQSTWNIPRKNIIFGQWIKLAGYWPDHQLRFFKKGRVSWTEEIHGDPIAKDEISKLDATESLAIVHYHYQSITEYVDRINRYTSIESSKRKYKNHKVNPNNLATEWGAEFMRRYYQKKGSQEGMHGLSLSLLQAFYQTVTQLKIWENQGFKKTSQSAENAFDDFISQFKYWRADYKARTSKNPAVKIYWKVRKKFRI